MIESPSVCRWEAVAVGRIAGYIFPALNSIELYRIAGKPVYLPHLVIGIGLTALLTILNYRGIRLSATFQNWTTFETVALFVIRNYPFDKPYKKYILKQRTSFPL